MKTSVSKTLSLVIITVLMTTLPSLAPASSHREAPNITLEPMADATDFYMFQSYDEDGLVNNDRTILIANYIPLQEPGGGPNYYSFADDIIYSINIDNDGDAVEDISFAFQFLRSTLGQTVNVNGNNIEVPFLTLGPVTEPNDPDINFFQDFAGTVVYGPVLAPNSAQQMFNITNSGPPNPFFPTPLNNFGEKTFDDYSTYAENFNSSFTVRNEGNTADITGRVFTGQRDDSFYADIAGVFDLLNLNPLGPEDSNPNSLDNSSVLSIVLEVPTSFLTDDTSNSPSVIAGTTRAYKLPETMGGSLTPRSRLGNPLINELIIGIGDKDAFNASDTTQDDQFLSYVTNPSLPALIEALFPRVSAPTLNPRTDLVQAFLTGIPGLNEKPGGTPSEMLRLNTVILPVARNAQNRLGVLGGDLAGFPNGRRPGDDVVDIVLRVGMGSLLDRSSAPSGDLPFTDGVSGSAMDYPDEFPFLNTPNPGATNPTSGANPFIVGKE